MTRRLFLAISALLTCGFTALIPITSTAAIIEQDFDSGEPWTTWPWYEFYTLDNYKADKDFITGMRPHHAGAITMSQDYLTNKEASSWRLQRLAGGIIDNQNFEVLMLDTVEKNIDSVELPDDNSPVMARVATLGLAQTQQFRRSPVPSLSKLPGQSDTVSAADVQFAKAMIVHHEGALMMCENYIDNPNHNNGYVGRMCLDILRDQAQEISLMHNIIQDYDGDPRDVPFDPSMIDGMDNMHHFKMTDPTLRDGHPPHAHH